MLASIWHLCVVQVEGMCICMWGIDALSLQTSKKQEYGDIFVRVLLAII